MRDKKSIEKELREVRETGNIELERDHYNRVQIELLLDIRHLLQRLLEKENTLKWGSKIP